MYPALDISLQKVDMIFFDQVILSIVKIGIAFDLKSIMNVFKTVCFLENI